MQTKTKILLPAALAVFLLGSGCGKPMPSASTDYNWATDNVQAVQKVAQKLYYVSGDKIFSYDASAGPNQIFSLTGPWATQTIQSILPSPDRSRVAVLIKDGKLLPSDTLALFNGDLTMLILDQQGKQISGYPLLQAGKISSFIYFWDNGQIFAKGVVTDKTTPEARYWRMEQGKNLTDGLLSDDYDSAVKIPDQEIVFTDFATSAYRRGNQDIDGDPITIDRSVITRRHGDDVSVLLQADKFFGSADAVFGGFQLSPDKTKIAFHNDVDSCQTGKNKVTSHLFIYNLQDDTQVEVVASIPAANYLWLDNNVLSFDSLGSGNVQFVNTFDSSTSIYSIVQESAGLFFTQAPPVCK